MITTFVMSSSGSPRAGPSWWQDALQPRLAPLQLLAALPAEAPERFPLPLRSRCFGEPCPEEVAVALAAEAQPLHDRLPPGHPARELYATLRDQACGAIATAQEADRALVEG
jgi:hypothetical protein